MKYDFFVEESGEIVILPVAEYGYDENGQRIRIVIEEPFN